MSSRQEVNQDIYQLKVVLKEGKPPIWRRFQTNLHLYRFDIGGIHSVPDPEDDFYDLHFVDSWRTWLSKVVSRDKARFTYEYDFGDSWEHQIPIKKILPPEPLPLNRVSTEPCKSLLLERPFALRRGSL